MFSLQKLLGKEDRFFTLLEAAKVSQQGDAHDGVSLLPLLKDPETKLTRDTWFFHYPHYYETTTPVSAVQPDANARKNRKSPTPSRPGGCRWYGASGRKSKNAPNPP